MAKIFEELSKIYDYLCGEFPEGEKNIFGIFLYGSQNYQIDTEDSDVDVQVIYVPSLREVFANKSPKSEERILPSGSHIVIKDIRLMIDMWKKANINFVEILFTNYHLINPMYKEFFIQLEEKREEIARYNPVAAVTAAYYLGVKNLDDSQITYKQLVNAMRLYDFCMSYLKGRDYGWCLIPKNSFLLRDLKMENKNGLVRDDFYFLRQTREKYDELKETLRLHSPEINYKKKSEMDNWFANFAASVALELSKAEEREQILTALDYFERRM